MEDTFRSFYKTVEGGEGDRCNYRTRLDMYGRGCLHNCSYCYARCLLEFRGNWNYNAPAIADRKEVLKTLDTIPEGSFLRLGGMTDPFQPIESQYHHTEWLIGELNDRNINYLIVTKGALVADCKEISPKLGHVQMSITHTHEPPIKDFEQASPWEDRLKAIETIYDRNIDAQIRLSPMIPGFIDPEIILASKVDKVLVEFLRVNTFIKRNMHSQFKPWTEQSGAYHHLPLGKKITMLKPYFGKKRLTICEDHPEHYEYFLHNINANPADCCDLRINKD